MPKLQEKRYTRREAVELVLAGLQSQNFNDWYQISNGRRNREFNGQFEKFIAGDNDAPSIREIEHDIVYLFDI